MHSLPTIVFLMQREIADHVNPNPGATMIQTYTIDAANLANLQARIAKIARRAAKLGCAAITLAIVATYVIRREFTNDEGVKFTRNIPVVDLSIDGEAPRLVGVNGAFELLATIEHTPGGNIIRECPTDLDDRGFKNVQSEIDAYRDADADCDHCNVSRKRNDTFLVYEGNSGTVRQIGRTCLQDFLGGKDPHAMVALADAYAACVKAVRGAVGNGPELELADLAEFLVYSAASIRLHGWVSKGKCRDNQIPTAQDAESCLWDWTGKHLNGKPIQADVELAMKALEYVTADLDAKGVARNSYQQNLWVIIQNGTVGTRHAGFAASIMPYYSRAIGQEQERVDYKARAAASNHIGSVKQRLTFKATVERRTSFEGRFGLTYIYKFRTTDGDAVTWFASREQDIAKGDAVTVTGTVKKHDDYKGEAQTVMTRCKIAARVATVKAAAADAGTTVKDTDDTCWAEAGEVPGRRLCSCKACVAYCAEAYGPDAPPPAVPQEWIIDRD